MIRGVSSTVNVNNLKSVSRIHQISNLIFCSCIINIYVYNIYILLFLGGWVVLTKMTPFDITHTTNSSDFLNFTWMDQIMGYAWLCLASAGWMWWNLEANSAIFAWFGWLKPCWNTGVHQLVRTNKGISQLMRRWWDMVGYGGYRTNFLGFQWPFWIV